MRVESWSNADDHGKTQSETLVERVHAGALVLCDRGSFRVAFCDQLPSRGIWWISRDAHQASSQVSHIGSHADGVLDAIVSLRTSQDNQTHSPVRLILCWLHGQHSRSLTTVRDPHVLQLSEVMGFDARRWDSERAFRAISDHLTLHHLWSAKGAVVQVHLWCCLTLAEVSHAFQVESAAHAGVDVVEVSLDLLIRLTPGWLSRRLTPFEHAVRCGRDLALSRPSTRHYIEVPRVDPCLGCPSTFRGGARGRVAMEQKLRLGKRGRNVLHTYKQK
jgi:hypothetical protein